MAVGKVIASDQGPSVFGFSFVVDEIVKKNQFVTVKSKNGLILGRVTNVFKTNKYFESIGAVKELSKNEMDFAFPTKDWEYTVAIVKCLGAFKNNIFVRVLYPPSPGEKVSDISDELLGNFLGMDRDGLNLGEVLNYDLKSKLNLTKMFQKHLAILAMSGSGKSYGCAVILEELLNRKKGKVGIVLIDNHGEYTGFKKDKKYGERVNLIDAEKIRISTENVSPGMFRAIMPMMSHAQVRDLGKVLYKLKQIKKSFSMQDLIDAVLESDTQDMVKEALVGWLNSIDRMNIFSTSNYPHESEIIKQGELTIIDFSKILDLKKKQTIVSLISRKLFNLRRKQQIPPYIEIIEEAHNFCPSGDSQENAISRGIIETLAREGRKFHAAICLISQRPVKLSTTVLSQCNTQIIMRITNPSDLNHIRESAEAISSEELDSISSLGVGEALVVGEAAKHPFFFRFRKRNSLETHSKNMEDYADFYESKSSLASADDF
jgi:DNA helicase HerA-like ATPase